MGLFPDWATPDWMKNAGLPVSEIDNADQPLIPAQVENYVPTTQQFQADNYIIPTNDNPMGVSEMDNATTDLTPAAARANGTANVSLDDIARQVMAEKNAPPQKEITVSSIANDLANSVGSYLKGAGQGFNEMRTAQLQQANNLMDGNYNQDDASYVNRAQQQFVKGTVEPIVMPAAMVVPQLRPIAGALMAPDIINSIYEKGLGKATEDFAYPILGDLRDQELEQKFREHPAAMAGQLSMDLVNTVLLGMGAKSGYRSAKKGVQDLNEYADKKLDTELTADQQFTPDGLDALDQYDNETHGFRPANADEMKHWNAEQQSKQDNITKAHDAAEQGDYVTAAIYANKAGDNRWEQVYSNMHKRELDDYGNVFDQEQEPRFGSDAQLSDMPQGAQGQTISPLLDALERAKQAKWDETQQDYSDQNNARQGLVNTLNEVAGQKFDDAENTSRNNIYDSLSDTDKLTADLLNHHNNESGVTPDEILSELKAERDRMLQDHVDHILETVDAQSPEQMVLENNSGDRFARNVSMKYDFANKAAQTVGKKYWSQLSKRDKNYLAQQEAESQLRNGYRDPMYGDIISDEMADHYNNLEAAINGLETSIPNIKSATRPEIWEPKQGDEGRTESLHQATEDARNIIGEAESPLHQQLIDEVEQKIQQQKEPWQMTKNDSREIWEKTLDENAPYYKKGDIANGLVQNEGRNPFAAGVHRQEVKRALAEGKPVPPKVLADYPDLKQQERPIHQQLIDAVKEQLNPEVAATGPKEVSPAPDFLSKISPDDINYETAKRAYQWNSMDPEGHATRTQQEYVNHVNAVYNELSQKAKTPEQKTLLDAEMERYKQGYISRKNAVLAATSRTASPMVTGPAKFPIARNQKALDTEHKRITELIEWDKKAQNAMTKKIGGESESNIISSDDPKAIEKLQNKIQQAEQNHETMKQTNAILRKKISDEEKVSQLQQVGIIEKNAREILKPDYAGRTGFPQYSLTNNLANIKRMKARVNELTQRQSREASETEFNGVKLIENTDKNRVQLLFDDKPNETIRKELKSHGFRYTHEGVWQRQLTPQAVNVAKNIASRDKLYSGFDPTRGKYDNITLKDIENGAFDKIYEAVTNSNKTPDTPLWRQRTEQPTQQERPTLTGNQAILAQNIPDEIRGLVEKYSPNYEREIPPLIPISPNNSDKSTNPIQYAINKLDKLYQAAIDDKHPLNKVDSELYKQARVANAKAYGQATELLTREGTNSFKDILEPVKHQTKEFSWYLEAVHSLDQQAAGLKTRMTPEDAQTVIDHAPDTFKTAQKQIVDYNGRLLDKLVEGKVLTQDAVDAMRQKWPNYVPFMRDFSDTAAIDSFVRSKGFINVANPIKKLKGSEREVIDPLESIIKNTYIFTNIAERNKVGLAFTKLADRPGEESVVVRVDGQHAQDTKLGIFTVYENGKKQAYRTTPELYKAMASLDGEASNFLTDILATPAGWLRAGATLTPDFMVRNATRDAISAYINSNSGFIPVVDTLKGLSHAFKKDDLYWDWLTNGGGMSTLISLDRQGLQTKLKDFRAKTGMEKLVTAINPKTYLEMLRTMSEYSELGTRLGVYDRATSKGINPLDSIIDSREASIDFGRSGTRAKMFNRISAFLNANLQDTDKLIRNFKDPKTRMRTMSKITTSLIIPSVAVWYMGKDDERVQRLPSWQKDLFWIVPTKASGPGWDGLIRIPKPFGPGVLFASGTERMLDWAYKNKKEPFKGYGGSMYDAFVPNIVPTAAVPLMEWWANKSMFTGQDIVPRREQGLSDKMQYGPNTTELAKKVGDTFNVSPRKVDNTVYGYTGGLGRNVTDIGNYFFKDRSNQPTTPVTQIPLAKAFTATSYNNSQPVQDYYDKVKETTEKMNDYKLKGIKPDDVTQQNHTDLNKSTKLMQGLLKAERAVMTDTGLTPDQKRQKLDDIQLYQSKAAEAIIKKLH